MTKQTLAIKEFNSFKEHQAEFNTQIMAALASIKDVVTSVAAEKSAKKLSKIGRETPIEIVALNKATEDYIRGIYEHPKPKLKKAYAKIVKIEVLNAVVTPKGIPRVEVRKTLNDGTTKEHPLMLWGLKQ